MPTSISAPLSSQKAALLRAGDAVAITSPILIFAVDETTDEDAGEEDWLPPTMIDGHICCLVRNHAGQTGGSRWQIARIDAPGVDRIACSLLAAGARACIATGRCSAAFSYALRKYRGVYLSVEADWLPNAIRFDGLVSSEGSVNLDTHAVVTVEQLLLTVTHDSQGHDLAAPD